MKFRFPVLFTLLCAFSSFISNAQSPSFQWDARFGGSGNDVLADVRQTADGGYIAGGWIESDISGEVSHPSRGGRDYWIVKTDASGNKQWDARFGGSGSDNLNTIRQTNEGGYIMGGWSDSNISGDKTQDAWETQDGWATFDYWIVKIDANGVKQWDKRFGGGETEFLESLQQTNDGGYILGGYSYSGISGDRTQGSRGSYDYWIVKIDANGVKQWDKRFGGSESDNLSSLQQTSDGGYIMGGRSESGVSGDRTQSSQGGFDYWIVKTNANGVKQWDKRFGGSDWDLLWKVEQTNDGGYILGGRSASGISGDKTQNSRGNFDYWIVKTNASGVKQWDRRYGGTDEDWLFDMQQLTDGGYLLGGWSRSSLSGDKTQCSHGGDDIWIVKVNAYGNKQWDARFGGSYAESFDALQQTDDGGYILGGWTNSSNTTIYGNISQPTRGSRDYWIVKIGGMCNCVDGNPFTDESCINGVCQYYWNTCNDITGFTLMNADDDEDLLDLISGAVINLENLPTNQLNIRVDALPDALFGSMVFELNGSYLRTENIAPYSAFGDNLPGDYHSWTPAPGKYELCVTPYSGVNGTGEPGIRTCITFEFIRMGVLNYTLVNAETNQDIITFSANPSWDDEDVVELDLSGLPHPERINLRVNTFPPMVGSVGFGFDGDDYGRTEHIAPYALFGDNNGNYNAWQNVLSRLMGGSCGGEHFCTVEVNGPQKDFFGNQYYGEEYYTFFRFRLKYEAIRVNGFTLVNAVTEQDLMEIQDGEVIDLSSLPTNKLNIRANTDPPVIGSVMFGWDKIENTAPYSLYGDNNGNYNQWLATPGAYYIEATPYSQSGTLPGRGDEPKGVCGIPLSAAFEFIQSGANKNGIKVNGGDESSELKVYPNPNAGNFTVSFSIDETADVKVEIIDVLGKVVFQDELRSFTGAYQRQFDFTAYSFGVYFLRVAAGQTIMTKKIVVTENSFR